MNKKLPMMVLISSPRMRSGEASDLEEMFELGLERLHLRKPDHSAKDVSKVLDKLPEKCLRRVVVHRVPELLDQYPLAGYHHSSKEKLHEFSGSCSRSLHKISNLRESKEKLDYTFFGPVYNSISKQGYGPKVSIESIRECFSMENCPPVFALGGIRRNKVRQLLEIGFSGVALLGAVWGRKDPVHALEGFMAVRDSILVELKESTERSVKQALSQVPPSLESLRK
jgi:thiamine-phosphate pyrophosphorylase